MERIGAAEYTYVKEVLDGGFHTSNNGKMTKRMEEAFAAKFSSKYAIAFCNGTATLHIALEAAGVSAGDEVIVPPLTMASTTLSVLHAGAVPVYADVDPDTFEISAKAIEQVITPKTKAIMPVSLFGLAPDFDAIMATAKKHNLAVIEDDAQCFLGKYKQRTVGTFGDMASFSFQASKHMTSGEGGVVITGDEELASKLRRLSGLGYASISAKQGRILKSDIQDPCYNRHASLGWNYRLSDLCSAVALGQLEHLEELVAARHRAAERHAQVLSGVPWLVPQKIGADYISSWWAYAVRLVDDSIAWKDFYKKYVKYGGPGFYAAWRLSYQEPFLQQMRLIGREKYIPGYQSLHYPEKGLCPNAEALQPRLMLFKTNYWDESLLDAHMEALDKTVHSFNG